MTARVWRNTHYPDPVRVEPVNRHTLAVIVDNEPGVLARIADPVHRHQPVELRLDLIDHRVGAGRHDGDARDVPGVV
jgi:hypothetical protein